MVPRDLVLMVDTAGLRSALIARLSPASDTLLTLDSGIDPAILDRVVRRPAVLIIDGATFDRRFAEIDRPGRWARVIVVAERPCPPDGDPRIRKVDPRHCMATIAAALGLPSISAAG